VEEAMAISKLPQPVSIQPMADADIDEVMEIERLSFRAPWSRNVFLEELGRDWARVDIVRTADTGAVVAFANYWLVADELHILNVAVHPQHRRQGHATRLLAHMVDIASGNKCRCVTLEVRRSNAVAQGLYRRFAFRAVGVRPNYYAEDQEDAIVMLLEMS
jgi:[ribosomal protein S18]-alanine N-acetyltransferase